jgi:LacI family transcriptional regulator
MRRHSPRLIDVARAARVSAATVSRALSAPGKVDPATRERIERVIRKVGYVPHGPARALALRRSRTVGTVVPTLTNAIFASTTDALQRSLDAAGYALLLGCNEYDPAAETRLARKLVERGVDGLVLFGLDHEPALWRLLETARVPYVLTWALERDGRRPCIGFDSRDAGARMARYLMDLGHRRIAVICGPTATNERHRERVRGVREALQRRGLKLPRARQIECRLSAPAGAEAMREVLRGKIAPTAVICANDVLAIGAMAECHARGLAIPGDVSVCGFDDLEFAAMIPPGLTTVRFPAAELGELAALHVLGQLEGREMPRQQALALELIVRGSTGARRA